MTISENLFMSILAMDSYHRGYLPGLSGLDDGAGGENRIGNATVSFNLVDVSDDVLSGSFAQAAFDEGFYAVAYTLDAGAPGDLGGKTVISYRGTSNFFGEDGSGGDVLNGWVQGSGQVTSQGRLAWEFYQAAGTALENVGNGTPNPNNIVLTGHSLGGGLAGLVSSLSDAQAYGYDNMPFAVSAMRLADELLGSGGANLQPDYSSFDGWYVDYELLESVRDATLQLPAIRAAGAANSLVGDVLSVTALGFLEFFGLGPQSLVSEMIQVLEDDAILTAVLNGNGTIQNTAIPTQIADDDFSILDRALYLHRADVAVVMTYANEHAGSGWHQISGEFHEAFANNEIASHAGVEAISLGSTGANALGAAVAYSALDGGELVFGNTGIRVMFNDLDEIGYGAKALAGADDLDLFDRFEQNLLGTSYAVVGGDLRETLVNTAVQYGGELAIRKVEVDLEQPGSVTSLGTMTKLSDNSFGIDLSVEKWNLNKSADEVTSGPTAAWHWVTFAVGEAIAIKDQIPLSNWFSGYNSRDVSEVSDLVASFNFGDAQQLELMPDLESLVFDAYGYGAPDLGLGELGFLQRYVSNVILVGDTEPTAFQLNPENVGLASNGSADLVIGTNGDQGIIGSDADEIVFTAGGADIVSTNGGDDLVIAGNGSSTIEGGAGNDVIVGDTAIVEPHASPDGGDLLAGGEGNDTIYGMHGDDVITGGLFLDEVLDPSEDNDLIFAGAGADTINDSGGEDTILGGTGNDYVIHSHESSSDVPLEEGDIGFEEFEGPTADLVFGGDDTDTLVLSEGGEIRAGLIEGELAFAISRDASKTDLAFEFEHIVGNGATLNFSGYDGDVTIDWTTNRLQIEGKTITFEGLTSIFPGTGDTTILGDQSRWLRSGDGDDELFSGGGNIRISGGAGQNTLHAQLGDQITGDADDTLILNGVTIAGEDIMFGTGGIYRDEFVDSNTTYPATRGTERLLEVDYAIMVEPLPIQVEADGTWSSIKWQGYIVFAPDLDTHFDQDGKFIKATADAEIIFNMGDFGIHTNGPFIGASPIGSPWNARNLFENNEYIDFGLGPGAAPIGTPEIDQPKDPVDFYDFVGLMDGDIERILEAFEDAGIEVEPELVAGTAGDDFLFGDFRNQIISGEGGNDLISGGRGDDYLSGNNGNDVYEFAVGDGADTIYEGGTGDDKIVFLKRDVADLAVTKVDGDYVLSFGNGDSVTIENPTHHTRVVEAVEFDDAVLTFEEVAAVATAAMQTDGDDTVDAFDGNDTIEGGLGNDVLSGRHGDDTFLFRIGDGQDTVNDQGRGNETLVFEGRVLADLTVARSGHDFVLSFSNGDGVTIVNPSHWTREIENVSFDDGTFTFADIVAVMTAASQTDGDDVINAYNEDDVLIGGLGNDTISGRHGDDTFIFRAGDGQDIVNDNGNGNDSIVFEGRDIAEATITREANHDYMFSFDNGDSVTIQNPTHWARVIENIVFDDGAFDFNSIAANVTASEQTAGDDHVRGFSGADTIVGGTGNDLLQGQHGDDTFIFQEGDGQDTVIDGGNGTDVLVFEGRDLADVTATQFGNDLILSFVNGDSVTIENPTHWTRIIENVSFDDTGILALDDLFV